MAASISQGVLLEEDRGKAGDSEAISPAIDASIFALPTAGPGSPRIISTIDGEEYDELATTSSASWMPVSTQLAELIASFISAFLLLEWKDMIKEI